MRFKLFLGMASLLVCQRLFGQVSPAAFQRSIPLKVGIGLSNFSPDWGNGGRISGPSLWLDWTSNRVPKSLNGLGLEIEGRDLRHEPTGRVPNLRFDTAAAGAVYSHRLTRSFRPYGKFLMGLGSIDFPKTKSGYSHDTRTIYEPGGGVELTVISRLKLRANYDYQFWPDMFAHHRALTPSGFTIGTSYDFGQRRYGTY